MDAREARRLKIARGVVRRMTDPRFRDSLTPDADGGRPVVVCLADDTVAYMFEMARAAGPVANVIVTTAGGGMGVVTLTAEHGDGAAPVSDEDHCPVHPDTHVDMLMTYLRRQEGPVRCVVTAPDYELGLLKELAGS